MVFLNLLLSLKQIDDKGYLLPYSVDGRQLMKIGVSFDAAERNIGEWKIVKYYPCSFASISYFFSTFPTFSTFALEINKLTM